jgi:predicted HD phosphohydrolase
VDPTNLTVDDIEALLGSAEAGEPVEEGAAYSHLDHALQTAALLRAEGGDDGLVAAGLLHDIGQLLPGIGDAAHAEAGAAGVRGAMGDRVAGLVGAHVDAKRYLAEVGGEYRGGLSAGSIISLSRQGGPMSSDERAEFEATPLFDDALTLRRADDRGKVDGLVVDGLDLWMGVVRRIAVSWRRDVADIGLPSAGLVASGPEGRGARRHHSPSGSDKLQDAIGVAGHLPSFFVHPMVMMGAQGHQIVEIGRAAISPMDNVVYIGKFRIGATGKTTPTISTGYLTSLGAGGESSGAAFVHGVAERVIERQGDGAIASDAADGLGAEEAESFDLCGAGAAT